MSFFHREDFCFRILNVAEETQSQQYKIQGAEAHKIIVYLRENAQSEIHFGREVYPTANVSMIFLPKLTPLLRRGEHEKTIVFDIEIFGREPRTPEIFRYENIHTILPQFSSLLKEWVSHRQGYRLRAHRTLYDIFVKLSTYETPSRREMQFQIISEGVRYFTENYTAPDCTIAEAARLSGISERYFRKVFAEIYGSSPAHYLRGMRIRRACELLASGRITITDIAMECGFDDQKYFSRTFREFMNTTPTAYARLFRNTR